MDGLQLEHCSHTCSSVFRRPGQGASDEGDIIARLQKKLPRPSGSWCVQSGTNRSKFMPRKIGVTPTRKASWSMDSKSTGSRVCFATDGGQLVEQTGGGAQCKPKFRCTTRRPMLHCVVAIVSLHCTAFYRIPQATAVSACVGHGCLDVCENVRCSTDGMFIAFSCSFRGVVFSQQAVVH